MFNFTLYKREVAASLKSLVVFAAILTMYISIVITMYDAEMLATLEQITASMPEVMAAVGMLATPSDLTGFISSYLYGMLLLLFPMVFVILRGHSLIARYVDRGSMVTLVASPTKRTAVAFTQMKAFATAIILLILYITALEIGVSEIHAPGALDIGGLLMLNLGLLCLQLCIGGICFFASCFFSDAKYSIGFGAGVPAFMFILQMVANTGKEAAGYFSVFTLFRPDDILAGATAAYAGIAALFGIAILLFSCSIWVFGRKDLHI